MVTRFAAISVMVLLTAGFVWRADGVAERASPTFDEALHLTAGVSYWRTGDFRLNSEHPPLLKLWWAIPVAWRSDLPFAPRADWWADREQWRIADAFTYESPAPPMDLIRPARRMNIILGVLLIALIARWSCRIGGLWSALSATALATTDPNLAAYSALLSMDFGLALFATATFYCWWEWSEGRSRIWLIGAGVMLGCAASAKFSVLATFAGIGSAGAIWVWLHRRSAESATVRSAMVNAVVRSALLAVPIVVTAYFVVSAMEWPRGLKQQLARAGGDRFYLNGTISATGRWLYFPEALALKTPPFTLVAALLGALVLLRSTRDCGAGRAAAGSGASAGSARDRVFLLLPACVYFLSAVAGGINLGWRVLLPAYPALIIAAGSAVRIVPERIRGGAAVLIVAGTVSITAVGAAFNPGSWGREELSYATPFVPRAKFPQYLGDSNIDWGQGLPALQEYLDQRGKPVIYLAYFGTARPEAFGIRSIPLPTWGRLTEVDPSASGDAAVRPPELPFLAAVSVTNLQGIYLDDPDHYRFLRERIPLTRLDGSIWIFEITDPADRDMLLRPIRRTAKD